MQRKERGTRGCACNCTVRCIEDDAVGACAARPMHVVSTSMSRRDLNFPTLSAPYRTPCPLSRALARTLPPPLLHVYSMQLSSPSAPRPPELAMRRDVARCGASARARVPSTCARESAGAGDHQHARACPETGMQTARAFLCTRDGT